MKMANGSLSLTREMGILFVFSEKTPKKLPRCTERILNILVNLKAMLMKANHAKFGFNGNWENVVLTLGMQPNSTRSHTKPS